MDDLEALNEQVEGVEAAERPKSPWGFARTRRLASDTAAVQGGKFKPRGFWSRPEVLAILRAVETTEDVLATAEALQVTDHCVTWRLRWLGVATPAENRKSAAVKAEVEALAGAAAE